jgi:hypothetical protein
VEDRRITPEGAGEEPAAQKKAMGRPPGKSAIKSKAKPAEFVQLQNQLRQMLAQNEELINRICALETAKAGGVVPLVTGGIDVNDPIKDKDLGPLMMVRILSSGAPAGVKIPDIVTLSGEDRNGKTFDLSWHFITDTPIRLPEDVITHLRQGEEREFQVLSESPIFQEWLRGNREPAHADCAKKGYDRCEMRRAGLFYVSARPYYQVIVDHPIQERLVVPAGVL